jgi:hypothetical protein
MFLPPGNLTIRSGRRRPVVGVHVLLFEEIAVIEHAGHLDHALELQFAPAAARLRRAQGLDQVAGLVAQLVLGAGQRTHLLGQRGIGIDARLLQALLICCSNFSSEVFTGATSSPMACWRFSSSPFAAPAALQRGAGKFEEALVVLRQRIGRKRLEGVGEAGAGRFQRGLALGEQGALAFQLALQRGAAYRQRRLLAAQGRQFRLAPRQRRRRLALAAAEDERDQSAAEQQAAQQGDAQFHVVLDSAIRFIAGTRAPQSAHRREKIIVRAG